MDMEFKLTRFEGPLDLLLHLIETNKIDIFDIPIVQITDQYMAYLSQIDREDLSSMSEFLVMASTLLDIKCRMLLPRETDEEGNEEDPREDLVKKLLEYKMYKYLSYELKECLDNAAGAYYKKPTIPKEIQKFRPKTDPAELLSGITLKKLNDIFQGILRRQEDKVDPIRSRFGKIEKEEVSLSEKMLWMRTFAKDHQTFSFRELLTSQASKVQVVVTFLSILELMKMGHLTAHQDGLFGDISLNVEDDPDTWKNLTEFMEEEAS